MNRGSSLQDTTRHLLPWAGCFGAWLVIRNVKKKSSKKSTGFSKIPIAIARTKIWRRWSTWRNASRKVCDCSPLSHFMLDKLKRILKLVSCLKTNFGGIKFSRQNMYFRRNAISQKFHNPFLTLCATSNSRRKRFSSIFILTFNF